MPKKSYFQQLVSEYPEQEEYIYELWTTEGNIGNWDDMGNWIKYPQKKVYNIVKEIIKKEIKNDK